MRLTWGYARILVPRPRCFPASASRPGASRARARETERVDYDAKGHERAELRTKRPRSRAGARGIIRPMGHAPARGLAGHTPGSANGGVAGGARRGLGRRARPETPRRRSRQIRLLVGLRLRW